MIEVLENVDWIEHREERGFWPRVLNEQLQTALSKLSKELDIDFVTVSQDQFDIKANLLKLGEDHVEVLKQ